MHHFKCNTKIGDEEIIGKRKKVISVQISLKKFVHATVCAVYLMTKTVTEREYWNKPSFKMLKEHISM